VKYKEKKMAQEYIVKSGNEALTSHSGLALIGIAVSSRLLVLNN